MDTEQKFVITLKIAKWRHLLFVICTWTFMQASCTDIACDVIFDQNKCAQKIIIRHQMQANEFTIFNGNKETVLLCHDNGNCKYDEGNDLINMSNGDLQLLISANHACMSPALKIDEAGEQYMECTASLEESKATKIYNATNDTTTSGSTTGPDEKRCTKGSDGNATSPSCSQDNENNDINKVLIAIPSIFFALVVIIVLVLCIYFYKKKKFCFRQNGLRNEKENRELEGGIVPDDSTTVFLPN